MCVFGDSRLLDLSDRRWTIPLLDHKIMSRWSRCHIVWIGIARSDGRVRIVHWYSKGIVVSWHFSEPW